MNLILRSSLTWNACIWGGWAKNAQNDDENEAKTDNRMNLILRSSFNLKCLHEEDMSEECPRHTEHGEWDMNDYENDQNVHDKTPDYDLH